MEEEVFTHFSSASTNHFDSLDLNSNVISDIPGVKPSDVSFAITLILHAMSPPSVKAMAQTGANPKGTLNNCDPKYHWFICYFFSKGTAETRTGSLTFTGTRDTKTASKINTSLYQVSFLALKMIGNH